jgi:hypothetical protein
MQRGLVQPRLMQPRLCNLDWWKGLVLPCSIRLDSTYF